MSRRGDEAVRTLRAFPDNPGSSAQAADDLGIRRNTVGHRVTRIFEQLEMDPDDPDQRVMVQLACRARSL